MLKCKRADWKAVNGTSLKGYVYADYATLVEMFGKEHSDGDGYKVDAEWCLQFSNGVVATIYNYKDGKNYNGSAGLAKEHITEWHVGGKDARAEKTVETYIEQQYALMQMRKADSLIE